MSSPQSNIWRPASLGNYYWGEWQDSNEVVLHFSGSGDTYLITQLGQLILEQLKKHPKTQEELASSLSDHCHIPEDMLPIPMELIESHLFHFQKLGLVEL